MVKPQMLLDHKVGVARGLLSTRFNLTQQATQGRMTTTICFLESFLDGDSEDNGTSIGLLSFEWKGGNKSSPNVEG